VPESGQGDECARRLHGVRENRKATSSAVPSASTPLVALIVLVALTLAGCGGGSGGGVSVAAVTRATVTETVDAPATVAARAQGSVSATAAGSVAQLMVRDGQRVRAGQVLMRLVSPSAQAQLARAQAADATAARQGSARAPGSTATAPATPPFDVTGLTRNVEAAQRAATTTLAQAQAAAAQLPAGPARLQALSAVTQLRAQVAAAGAAATGALAQLGAGVASTTGQLAAVAGQATAVGGQLQTALAALAGAQRTQSRAAVQTAQAEVDGLIVRAPVAGVVQLGTGSAPAGGTGGAGLDALLAQLPASVSGSLGSLAGTATGAGAAASGPPEGSTTSVPIAVGAPVAEGGLLAIVFDTSALTLAADIDETAVLTVKAGIAADVEIDAVPGAHYDARVTSVDTSSATSARGGVSYRVHLALGAGTLADGGVAPAPRPGMSAVATLRVRTETDAVSLPVAAVVKAGDRDTVWVDEAGRATRRPVRLGAQGDTLVAVDGGLGVGERVVVRGAESVREGQHL